LIFHHRLHNWKISADWVTFFSEFGLGKRILGIPNVQLAVGCLAIRRAGFSQSVSGWLFFEEKTQVLVFEEKR